MPVDFLTDEQKQRYGRYVGEPSPEQLARYFHLSESDRIIVAERRGDHNRLGFALQLCSVRFLGAFLVDPLAVPMGAIRYVANQLGLADLCALARYGERVQTQQEHALEIRQRFGYREWSHPRGGFALLRFLYAREWISAERPSVLFDLAVAWLLDAKVALPGITTLERLVARVRERVAERAFRILSQAVTSDQSIRLERLLDRDGSARLTTLERLRRSPSHASANTLVAALARLEELRQLDLGAVPVGTLSAHRLRALASYAVTSKASTLARLAPDRRVATLLACARWLEGTALDDALDVLDLVLHDLLAHAEGTGKQARLRTLRDLDTAALQLCTQVEYLLSQTNSDTDLRAYLDDQQITLKQSMDTIYAIARPPDDRYVQELTARYPTVRRFLPRLLSSLTFQATPAGQPVLAGLGFLRALEGHRRPSLQAAPLEVIPAGWRRAVLPDDTDDTVVDRRAYTLCVLTRLREALRRRDVFVVGSSRWGDPRAKLLSGEAWERVRATVCQSLGRSITPQPELDELATRLDAAYRQAAALLPNATVRFEPVKPPAKPEEERLVLTPLEKLEEPESLRLLRSRVARRLPAVQLPELLFGTAPAHRLCRRIHPSE